MHMSKPRFVRLVHSLLAVMAATIVMVFAPQNVFAQRLEIDASTEGAARTYAMPVVLPSEYNGGGYPRFCVNGLWFNAVAYGHRTEW